MPGSRQGPIKVLDDTEGSAEDSKAKIGDSNFKEGTKSQGNMEKFLLDEPGMRSETISKRSEKDSEDRDSVDRVTRSRATTNFEQNQGEGFSQSALAVHDAEKIWTEEELLADEDLWKVTDESEESESEADAKGQTRSKFTMQNTPNLRKEPSTKKAKNAKNGDDRSTTNDHPGRSQNAS